MGRARTFAPLSTAAVVAIAASFAVIPGAGATARPKASRSTATRPTRSLSASATATSPSTAKPGRTTTSLLTDAASTFDTGDGGWAAFGGVVAPATDVTRSGSGSLGVSSNGGDVWVVSPSRTVAPGDIVQGSAFVRVPASHSIVAAVQFLDATGANVGMIWGGATSAPAGSWTETQPFSAFVPAKTATARLVVVTSATTAGETFNIDDATLYRSTGTPAGIRGPLRASGNRIVDGNGAAVTLRGIHRDGEQLDRYPSDAEIARAQQWGSNVVRVPMSESLWLNTCTAGAPTKSASYANNIDGVVSSITSRGMVAILELHYNVIENCGWSSQHSMADAAYAPEFWRQVAARYKSNDRVVFELYNEPHDVTSTVWRDGGTVVENGKTFQAAGMNALAAAVRSTGATNLVLAGGISWGSAPSGLMVSDPNVAYSAHFYTCPRSAPPNCGWAYGDPVDPSPLMSQWSTLLSTAPVVVTEFGWPDATDGRYNRNVVDRAERMGFSGWVGFAWDGGNAGQFSLLKDMTTYWQPSRAGMPVLAGLTLN